MNYFWPGMDKDITDHIKRCHRCQVRKMDHRPSPQLLAPLPQCSEPNQLIHADLFGLLKTTDTSKKYILAMTDACTKYVELVALPDKEALTVTSAIFSKWICRYGLPLELITDQGSTPTMQQSGRKAQPDHRQIPQLLRELHHSGLGIIFGTPNALLQYKFS
jgi:hypothetical protein